MTGPRFAGRATIVFNSILTKPGAVLSKFSPDFTVGIGRLARIGSGDSGIANGSRDVAVLKGMKVC